MSAGNLIGSIFNTILFGGVWWVLGYGVEKLFRAFNHVIAVLPTMQDAVNGFTVLQQIWIIVPVIILGVIWVNYALNENSQASGGV